MTPSTKPTKPRTTTRWNRYSILRKTIRRIVSRISARASMNGARMSPMDTADTPVGPDRGAVTSDPWLSVLSSALDGSQPVDPLALVKAQLEAQGDDRARLLLRILERQHQHRDVSTREW